MNHQETKDPNYDELKKRLNFTFGPSFIFCFDLVPYIAKVSTFWSFPLAWAGNHHLSLQKQPPLVGNWVISPKYEFWRAFSQSLSYSSSLPRFLFLSRLSHCPVSPIWHSLSSFLPLGFFIYSPNPITLFPPSSPSTGSRLRWSCMDATGDL